MNSLDVLIGGIATWRITRLLLTENGPFRLLRKFRERFGVVYAQDDDTQIVSFKYEIFLCMWCMSIWVGLALTLLQRFVPGGRWFLLPFTYSAINAMVARQLELTKKKADSFPEFRVNQ